ncbi:MAG: group II intron reverse transcriptase/maturase [Dehalococcoidia bacterium]
MPRTSGREAISTRQQQIATLARHVPKQVLTTLAHHIEVGWLHEAYRRTRKDGAVGIDGVTAAQYEAALEANLLSLLERFKSGRYRAPAVRRVHIPKGGAGKATRPIGIPTLEDKVLQRAVVMALDPVYEADFRACSYGFRPGRSAHGALDALWHGLTAHGGGWVIDLDIQHFFDSVDRGHLRRVLDQRVRDGVIRRAIGKWLRAGVMEAGRVWYPEQGTPQGGVVSPLLSNIFLHEVLDTWFLDTVQPRLRGPAFLVRFADDAVMGFACEDDARRVLAVLPRRLGKYGLTLHPEKTQLVDFRRPRREAARGPGRSFTMLGFTHYWGRSRHGRWVVRRKTAAGRLSRALQRIGRWCATHRHHRVRDQQVALNQKLRGHYQYYGVTGNARALAAFRRQVERRWRTWLNRRSRATYLDWGAFRRLLCHYPLIPPRVVHSIYRGAASP